MAERLLAALMIFFHGNDRCSWICSLMIADGGLPPCNVEHLCLVVVLGREIKIGGGSSSSAALKISNCCSEKLGVGGLKPGRSWCQCRKSRRFRVRCFVMVCCFFCFLTILCILFYFRFYIKGSSSRALKELVRMSGWTA